MQLINIRADQTALDNLVTLLEYTAERLGIEYYPTDGDPVKDFRYSEGYGSQKESFSWESRVFFWANTYSTKFLIPWYKKEVYRVLSSKELIELIKNKEVHPEKVVPLFANYANKGGCTMSVENIIANLKIKEQEKPKMKNFLNTMLDANKDAAVLGAKLTVGKTVNDFLGAKLYKSLPWFTRLFSSKKNATNSAVTKLVAANLVTAAVKVKGGNNEKLEYIAEAMLQDAMVCATRDTEFLNDLISQVEKAASLPDGVLESIKGETK